MVGMKLWGTGITILLVTWHRLPYAEVVGAIIAVIGLILWWLDK